MKIICTVAWILSILILLGIAAIMIHGIIMGRMVGLTPLYVTLHLALFAVSGLLLVFRKTIGRFAAAAALAYIIVQMFTNQPFDAVSSFEFALAGLLATMCWFNLFSKTYGLKMS